MVEAAVTFVVAFLGRQAAGLVERVGSDVNSAFDDKVADLYEWVKARLSVRRAGRRAIEEVEMRPDDESAKRSLEDQLSDEVEADPGFAAEMTERVEALEAARPASWSVTSGSGPAIGGDVDVRADRGSAAAVQMRDVTLGGSPNPSEPGRPPA